MAERWFIVQLDLERIRSSFSRDDGCEYDLAHVRKWLSDAGFRPDPNGWLVRERDLAQVQPDEVTAIDEHPGPAADAG
jgi:hypothetical protein